LRGLAYNFDINSSFIHFHYTHLSVWRQNSSAPKELGAKWPVPNIRRQNGGAKSTRSFLHHLAALILFALFHLCLFFIVFFQKKYSSFTHVIYLY